MAFGVAFGSAGRSHSGCWKRSSLSANPLVRLDRRKDSRRWTKPTGLLFEVCIPRTCLHARAVLTLLSNGLVDPALAQWRVCHESSTIARFITNDPEMAPRYMNFSYVNKYHLARQLRSDRRHLPRLRAACQTPADLPKHSRIRQQARTALGGGKPSAGVYHSKLRPLNDAPT